jgi:hypothetical protein
MSPEEKELLDKSVALGEENNKILRSMQRSMIWGRVWRTFYWFLIIGSTVGAYYFVQPYIDQILEVYGGAKSNIEGINSLFKR